MNIEDLLLKYKGNKKGIIAGFIVFVFFLAFGIIALNLSFQTNSGRNEFNINGLRFFVVPFLLVIAFVFLYLTFKVMIFNSKIKKDLKNIEILNETGIVINKIKLLKKHLSRYQIVIEGVIIYSYCKKYYMYIDRCVNIENISKKKLKNFYGRKIDIKFYANSGIVIDCNLKYKL